MMNVFEAYSEYYDLLYSDKNYKLEVNYLQNLVINNIKTSGQDLLNLGCGTGKHDFEFENIGYNVLGVDLSKDMIELAIKERPINSKCEFMVSDIRKLNLNKKFDVITSLFHVINYQNSNVDLNETFEVASKHLKKGGLFIFDFWNGSGVLTDLPITKTKCIENSNILVERRTFPNFLYDKNIVEVNFDINIKSKKSGEIKNIVEKHSMRYLFLPEIEEFAKDFTLLNSYKWLTNEPLLNNWYGIVILIKN